MPSFCVKSVKIYTSQIKFTRAPLVVLVTNIRYVYAKNTPAWKKYPSAGSDCCDYAYCAMLTSWHRVLFVLCIILTPKWENFGRGAIASARTQFWRTSSFLPSFIASSTTLQTDPLTFSIVIKLQQNACVQLLYYPVKQCILKFWCYYTSCASCLQGGF